eukprot:426279-Rhodomonas_salina.2
MTAGLTICTGDTDSDRTEEGGTEEGPGRKGRRGTESEETGLRPRGERETPSSFLPPPTFQPPTSLLAPDVSVTCVFLSCISSADYTSKESRVMSRVILQVSKVRQMLSKTVLSQGIETYVPDSPVREHLVSFLSKIDEPMQAEETPSTTPPKEGDKMETEEEREKEKS